MPSASANALEARWSTVDKTRKILQCLVHDVILCILPSRVLNTGTTSMKVALPPLSIWIWRP